MNLVKSEAQQGIIDYSRIAEDSHKAVGPDEKVHPHRKHYKKHHCALSSDSKL